MSDDELDRTVKNCVGENQRIGPNAVKAKLFSHGANVQRWRVRDSMMRVDQGGIALRAAMTIQRRTYAVAGPNCVWHIDGNHKLIRSKNRLMTWLKLSKMLLCYHIFSFRKHC